MAATDTVGVVAGDMPQRYKFVRVLGTGANGIVSEALDTKSGEKVAIKAMHRIDTGLKLKREVATLRRVQHPNCIRLKKIEETSDCTYLVMDLCSGGELFEKIMRNGPLPEASARKIAVNLFEAVAHLHKNEIMHRDLKLENILFTRSGDLDVKIADFGLAVVGSRARDLVGSLQYMAPEISMSLNQGYTAAVDCWSLGIILHGIMLGFLPYNFVSTDEVEEFAYGASPPVELFGYDECSLLSSGAKDLISKLLVRDPAQRLSAQDALSHPWVTGSSAYPLVNGVATDREHTRPVKRKAEAAGPSQPKRKAEAAEPSSPCKRRLRSDSENSTASNLLFDSPDCPSALPLGPRDLSLELLELPACRFDDALEDMSVKCFVRPEGQLFV